MSKSNKLVAAAIALPLAFGLALPASAGPRHGNSDYRNAPVRAPIANHRIAARAIERDLDAIRYQIRDGRRSGILSRYEARIFRQRLAVVERSYRSLARNGVSRRDERTISFRIDNLRDQLNRQRFAYNNRGNDRRDQRRRFTYRR